MHLYMKRMIKIYVFILDYKVIRIDILFYLFMFKTYSKERCCEKYFHIFYF